MPRPCLCPGLGGGSGQLSSAAIAALFAVSRSLKTEIQTHDYSHYIYYPRSDQLNTGKRKKKKPNYSLAWLLWGNKFFHIISHIRKAGESLRENEVLTFLGNKRVSFSFLKSKINKSRGSLLCVCMPAQFIYFSGTTEYPLRLLLKDVLFWNQTLDYRPCNIFSSVP